MKFLLIILFSTIILGSYCQTDKNVLFIGNSLTHYNHNKMTHILSRFLKESKENIVIDHFTKNGIDLDGHLKYVWYKKNKAYSSPNIDSIQPSAIQKINSKEYNIIILQERGGELLKEKYVENEFIPVVQRFEQIIKKNKSDIYFYEPIPYLRDSIRMLYRNLKNPKKNKFYYYSSIESQIDTIDKVFNRLKDSLNSSFVVVPVGKVIYKYHKKYPSEKLFTKSRHPNKTGQYIIACCFYIALTNSSPEPLTYSFRLKPSKAKKIREFVWSNYQNNN